jgi:hypothetical protein
VSIKALTKGILLFMVSLLIFAALLHTQAVNCFLITPFLVGLIMGLMGRDMRVSAGIAAAAALCGTFVFLHPQGTPDFPMVDVLTLSRIDARLARMACLSYPLLTAIAAALAGAAAGVWICRAPRLRRFAAPAFLLLAIANLVVLALTFDAGYLSMISREPRGATPHDGFMILKTFYNLERGMGYYEAFGEAFKERMNEPTYPGILLQWRLPTAYLLWSAILPPSGYWIYLLYLFLSSITLIASWLIARTAVDDVSAAVAPLLLGPYFLYGALFLWFTYVEFWGIFALFWGVLLYLRKREPAAAPLFALALCVREIFVLACLVPGVISLFTRKLRSVLPWLLVPVPFFVLYLFHYLSARCYLTAAPSDIRDWLQAGWGFFTLTAAFGFTFYADWTLLYRVILYLGIVGAAMYPEGRARAFLLGLILLPPTVFLFIGHFWDFYWGIAYMPFAITCVPLVLRLHGDFRRAAEPV